MSVTITGATISGGVTLGNATVTTNGLIMYVDAGNVSSYSGTGTTWTDLSGQNNNLTIAGAPAFNASTGFTFPGAEITKYVISNPFNNMPSTTLSYEIWLQTSGGGGIISYASTAADNDFLMYDTASVALYTAAGSVASGVNIATNTWKQVVRTSNRTSGQENLYVNGILQFNTTLTPGTLVTNGGSFVLAQEQDAVGGGFDPGQALVGNIIIVRLYNKVLSDAEVMTNFTAQRGRFGI